MVSRLKKRSKMRSVVYVCDRCHTQKKPDTHWVTIVLVVPGTIVIKRLVQDGNITDTEVDAKHLCGQKCVVEEVAEIVPQLR